MTPPYIYVHIHEPAYAYHMCTYARIYLYIYIYIYVDETLIRTGESEGKLLKRQMGTKNSNARLSGMFKSVE